MLINIELYKIKIEHQLWHFLSNILKLETKNYDFYLAFSQCFFFTICDQLISSYPKISVCLKLVDFNLNKFCPFN